MSVTIEWKANPLRPFGLGWPYPMLLQLVQRVLQGVAAVCSQELEKHSVAFVRQAQLLAAWDSAVLSNRHALLDVEQELRQVHAGQEALERQLGMIETHQKVGRLYMSCARPVQKQEGSPLIVLL